MKKEKEKQGFTDMKNTNTRVNIHCIHV